jgi:CTP:molybdopterin cytidylyltransferase MocA
MPTGPDRGRVAGIVLAAGFARRAGGADKLLVPVDGRPIIRHVAGAASDAGLDPVVVVVRPGAAALRSALRDLTVTVTENPDAHEGLSASLRCGIRALPEDTAGVAILLGDMPWIRPATLRALALALDDAAGRSICVPVHDGTRGNPVVWSARFLPAMTALTGDAGARGLLQQHAASVHEVVVDDVGVLRDVDTADQIERLRSGLPCPH